MPANSSAAKVWFAADRAGENSGQSALARRAQIAQLDRELDRRHTKTGIPNGRHGPRPCKHSKLHRTCLLAARERFQRAQVESASIQNEQKLAERQLADLENRRATYIQETVQIGESLRASLTHLGESRIIDRRHRPSLSSKAALRRAEAEQAANVARERENSVVEDLNEIRVRVATERQQQENLNRQRGPMAARLAELAEILETRRADIAGYESRIETLEAESRSLRESIAGWQERVGLAGRKDRGASLRSFRAS